MSSVGITGEQKELLAEIVRVKKEINDLRQELQVAYEGLAAAHKALNRVDDFIDRVVAGMTPPKK